MRIPALVIHACLWGNSRRASSDSCGSSATSTQSPAALNVLIKSEIVYARFVRAISWFHPLV